MTMNLAILTMYGLELRVETQRWENNLLHVGAIGSRDNIIVRTATAWKAGV
jgi:hypothetical protein